MFSKACFLFFWGSDLRVLPCLAVSWENPDELTWVFRLRAGVEFHDGSPLAAADVVDPEFVPCLHVVCGEILLHEGSPVEAAEALKKALNTPGIAPEWKARAEARLETALEPAVETEEADQPTEAPGEAPGGEAEREG